MVVVVVAGFGSFPALCAGQLRILQLSGCRWLAGSVVSTCWIEVPVGGAYVEINGSDVLKMV